jgi:hypothetical protein
MGNDALKEAPQSVAELAATEVVFGVNALFGQGRLELDRARRHAAGTRRGEVGARLSMMLPSFGPELALVKEHAGNPIGNFAGDLFGTKNGAPTSGAAGSAAARAGQSVHGGASALFAGLFD